MLISGILLSGGEIQPEGGIEGGPEWSPQGIYLTPQKSHGWVKVAVDWMQPKS